MTLDVRRLGPDDAEPARQLGMEAFGVPSNPPTSPATIDQPGMKWYGAIEDDLLVARLVDREYDAYFGGMPVLTCGVGVSRLQLSIEAKAFSRRCLPPCSVTLRSAGR